MHEAEVKPAVRSYSHHHQKCPWWCSRYSSACTFGMASPSSQLPPPTVSYHEMATIW
jgi:hypothetical protein